MRNVLFAVFVFCSLQVSAQLSATPSWPLALVSNINVTDYRTAPAYTISQILAVPKLTPRPPAKEIVAYTMFITKSNGDQIGPFAVKGGDMSQEMKDALNSVRGRSGSIYIDDIKVIAADGSRRSIGSINIRFTN